MATWKMRSVRRLVSRTKVGTIHRIWSSPSLESALATALEAGRRQRPRSWKAASRALSSIDQRPLSPVCRCHRQCYLDLSDAVAASVSVVVLSSLCFRRSLQKFSTLA
eukprot:213851-Amphidinium_carterae.1